MAYRDELEALRAKNAVLEEHLADQSRALEAKDAEVAKLREERKPERRKRQATGGDELSPGTDANLHKPPVPGTSHTSTRAQRVVAYLVIAVACPLVNAPWIWIPMSGARGDTTRAGIAFVIAFATGVGAAISMTSAALGLIAPGTVSITNDEHYQRITIHSRARGLRALACVAVLIAVEIYAVTQVH